MKNFLAGSVFRDTWPGFEEKDVEDAFQVRIPLDSRVRLAGLHAFRPVRSANAVPLPPPCF